MEVTVPGRYSRARFAKGGSSTCSAKRQAWRGDFAENFCRNANFRGAIFTESCILACKLQYQGIEPSAPWSGASSGRILTIERSYKVRLHVLKAVLEIPLCVSYLFLVVRSLQATLSEMRTQYAGQTQSR